MSEIKIVTSLLQLVLHLSYITMLLSTELFQFACTHCIIPLKNKRIDSTNILPCSHAPFFTLLNNKTHEKMVHSPCVCFLLIHSLLNLSHQTWLLPLNLTNIALVGSSITSMLPVPMVMLLHQFYSFPKLHWKSDLPVHVTQWHLLFPFRQTFPCFFLFTFLRAPAFSLLLGLLCIYLLKIWISQVSDLLSLL